MISSLEFKPPWANSNIANLIDYLIPTPNARETEGNVHFLNEKNDMKKLKHYGRKNQSIISEYLVFHWYDKN